MSHDNDRWELERREEERERIEATRRAEERHRHEVEERRRSDRDYPDRPWR